MDGSLKTDIENQLEAHLIESAKKRGKAIEELDVNHPFFDAGVLDSLSLLDFVSFIETQFGIQVGSLDIVPDNFGSLRAVTEYVARRLDGILP